MADASPAPLPLRVRARGWAGSRSGWRRHDNFPYRRGAARADRRRRPRALARRAGPATPPVTPPARPPTRPSEDGLLDQLKRKLRPGPSSVAAGPFYLRTSIAPLRMPATPGPAVELPTGTEFRPATAQWIQERSAALVDRLHPAAQASTGAAGALGAAGAGAATDATDGTGAPGSIVGTP